MNRKEILLAALIKLASLNVIVGIFLLEACKSLGLFPGFYVWLEIVLGGDLVLHYLVAFILYLGCYWFFSDVRKSRVNSFVLLIVLTGLLAITELVHAVLPNRSIDVNDFMLGFLGVFSAWLMVFWLQERINRSHF